MAKTKTPTLTRGSCTRCAQEIEAMTPFVVIMEYQAGQLVRGPDWYHRECYESRTSP